MNGERSNLDPGAGSPSRLSGKAKILGERRCSSRPNKVWAIRSQFCRYAARIKADGAKIVLQVQDRLVKLMGTLDPDIKVIGTAEQALTCDYHIMLLSIPGILWASDQSAGRKAYLAADPERTVLWRGRLGAKGFKVGIHWQGERKWDGIAKASTRNGLFPSLVPWHLANPKCSPCQPPKK